MTTLETAQLIADRLLHELPAEEVWLFGSQARGDARLDSDLDVLAVVRHSNLPRHERTRAAHALVADIPFPKDVIVLTREEWTQQEEVVNSLPYVTKKEGIRLRAA